MIARYTRPEMGRIFSDENRFAQWLDVELAASEALAETGEVPAAAAKALRAHAGFDRSHARVRLPAFFEVCGVERPKTFAVRHRRREIFRRVVRRRDARTDDNIGSSSRLIRDLIVDRHGEKIRAHATRDAKLLEDAYVDVDVACCIERIETCGDATIPHGKIIRIEQALRLIGVRDAQIHARLGDDLDRTPHANRRAVTS